MRADRGPTKPFDLVVFDCDGVLVDSERLLVPIDAAILNDLGASAPTPPARPSSRTARTASRRPSGQG